MTNETSSDPDHAEQAEQLDDAIPTKGYSMLPVVGIGGSAGAIQALKLFFESMRPDSDLAFVIVMHLSREHESSLSQLLQRSTTMRVLQVTTTVKIEPNTVYVIPPGKAMKTANGHLELTELPVRRRHVAVDLFLRTLADTHGPHAVAVVLSGLDSDGAIGVKRIKERGGLTVVQDPTEAEHGGMPRSAMATGMVDWVLPVRDMAARIVQYVKMERSVRLPAEPAADEAGHVTADDRSEAALRNVLSFMRTRTGRDFTSYKRATILRRIRRRMQVNGVEEIEQYDACLRTRSGEAGALLQDLLITVTNFFRDAECFAALAKEIPGLFERASEGPIRIWVPACATGEEAFSIAILMFEHARQLDPPPQIQIFATDLDEEAIRTAREGLFPATIEADVPEDLLRRYFLKELGSYRIRREVREIILFAVHDVLKDSPFSRLHFVSCRNLLIYLNRDAQRRLLDTFHFALRPEGLLMLGSSESIEGNAAQFTTLDKKHRIFQQRSAPRVSLPVPTGPGTLALAFEAQHAARSGPVISGSTAASPADATTTLTRPASWGELHFKLLEILGPPSILVDAEHEIVHLSPSAGRFLQFAGGEPSRNLLRAIHPDLRIELRAALYQASQSRSVVEIEPLSVELRGEAARVRIIVKPANESAPGYLLVLLSAASDAGGEPQKTEDVPQRSGSDPVAHQLDREVERLKAHLRDTVEQYEASVEELKASNEELQAMNEELRSATEELETSREELQSINEELTTVNQELKHKVDELGNSNSDMQNLMDATAIATIFLDRELRITRFTPSAVGLFNLIPGDLGRPLSDLTTHVDYDRLAEDAAEVLKTLIPAEREVAEARGNWYLVRLRPYRTLDDRIGGVVLTFVDVTERRLAEEALRRSEERMRLVFENAVEYAILAMDLQRRVTTWSSGAERLLGYTESEIVGRQYDVLFTDGDRENGVPESEFARAAADGRARDDQRHVRKDGTQFWASGAVMPIYASGGSPLGFVKILRDRTEDRLREEKLERSRVELLAALEEKAAATRALEIADAAKDRFLALLSHELRNPLASVRAAAQIVAEPDARPEARDRAAKIIERQTSAMKILLEDLADTSRLRLGKLALRMKPLVVGEVINRAIETTRPALDASKIELSVDVPTGLPLLFGDELRLSQVFSNLLSNAAKHTPAGGQVTIAVTSEDDAISCTVTDTGEGIEPSNLESIFELFWQGNVSEVNAATEGFGLGLALSRTIVELHGGTLTAQSQGKMARSGSTFTVRLPLGEAGQLPPSTDDPARDDTIGTKLLVVDDDADAAWTIAKTLEIAGLEVSIANDGPSALAKAEELRPAIVVLDISMPGMQGDEVARRIRAQPWATRTRLIAVTGWSIANDVGARSEVFDAYLMKPVGIDELFAAISSTNQRTDGTDS